MGKKKKKKGKKKKVVDENLPPPEDPLDKLTERFASKLGATAAQASAKFASGKGLSDLKPFYGQVFEQEIAGYSHWGWVDWDLLLGDLRSVIGIERFWESEPPGFQVAPIPKCVSHGAGAMCCTCGAPAPSPPLGSVRRHWTATPPAPLFLELRSG